ncbi:MAG: hypothetical protein ABIS69_08805 [Sediminibacterium sp.]
MYTLLGFIQTLLMLTQSRLMPDLSMLWEPRTEIAAVVSHTTNFAGNSIRTSAFYSSPLEALRIRDKENWKPPALNTERKSFPVLLQNIKPYRRPIINKRYLVFCQWKTEG